MKTYNYYLLDLDNTLCDFKSAMESGNKKIAELLSNYNIDYDSFMTEFIKQQNLLLKEFLSKKLTESEYRIRRYEDTLKFYSINNSRDLAVKLDNIFTKETTENIKVFDDVIPFLKKLTENKKQIAIVTNGNAKRQRMKFKSSVLAVYTNNIFISGELGHAKPDKYIFNKAMEAINAVPSETLMIGDSLEHDILGAESVGIDAILINRYNKPVEFNGQIISSFKELEI